MRSRRQPSLRPPAIQGPLHPLKKRELTVILVGETGVGKTSLMSLLANVCDNRTIHEFIPQHNPDNDTNLAAMHSQTKAAMLYEMTRYDGVRIRVLDTPGLCDTRGIEQDAEHKASIADAIRDYVVQVDAVIVMANGTNTRLTVPTDYALSTLSAMFPASIASNIGFLFTNVESPLTFNFQQSSLPECLQDAELFTLQNPLALLLKYQELQQLDTSMSASKKKIYERSLAMAYTGTLDTLNDMFSWMDERQARPTAEISHLYNLTIGMEADLTDILARLDQIEQRRNELKRLRAKSASHEQTMKINEQYEKIIKRAMHVQRDTPGHHTTQCTVAGCYSNCHESCHLEFLLDPAELGRRCTAFDLSRNANPLKEAIRHKCETCGHRARDHRHFHSVWAIETTNEHTIDEDARRSYDAASRAAAAYSTQMAHLEAKIASYDTELERLEKQLADNCERFQELALNGNFSGHLESTVDLLKYRRETRMVVGDPEGFQALTNLIEVFEKRIRVIQEVERKKQEGWGLTKLANNLVSRLRVWK
ncbi:hypothetical protein EXIGLDRAFT_602837 [Exidia glandulosa HHB12029]|uniref:AIG1-type G domain-containing protein n=1 Tax=Exidia glandulosa HHB12029 TaxID=1314781 RepID=A0A165P235_EXIGL|nr:hypothetical protein EXIGLDRAFT_602837 [Exidia glandulosa HHB12029]